MKAIHFVMIAFVLPCRAYAGNSHWNEYKQRALSTMNYAVQTTRDTLYYTTVGNIACAGGALTTAALIAKQLRSYNCRDIAKAGIIATAGIMAAKGLYNYFCEQTDCDEMETARTQEKEILDRLTLLQEEYGAAFQLLNNTDAATLAHELRKIIQGQSMFRPFLSYVQNIDTHVRELEQNIRILIERKVKLTYRAYYLIDDKNLAPTIYKDLRNRLTVCELSLNETITNIETIKETLLRVRAEVVQYNEYTQEHISHQIEHAHHGSNNALYLYRSKDNSDSLS